MSKEVISFYSKSESLQELSNFFEIPGGIIYDGKKYRSSEHAFQAQKYAVNGTGNDVKYMEYMELIRSTRSPFAAKLLANQKKHKKFSEQDSIIDAYKVFGLERRVDWAEAKFSIMKDILICKFTQSKVCKNALLSTESADLVEDNPHDSCWGTGPDGMGQNEMGILLMEIRSNLIASACITISESK